MAITKLEKDLWSIDEVGTYMYLINGEKEVLLIDTAYGLHDLKETIKELCGDKKIRVINLHAHIDHNAGNNQFEKIYVGRLDEPFSHRTYSEEEKKQALENDFLLNVEGTEFSEEMWNPGPASEVYTLTDGEIIDIGGYQFRVLETPGHTQGSICLFEAKKGWLFTGDLILTWPIWCHLDNSATLKEYGKSLGKLRELETKVQGVFPSHWNGDIEPERYCRLPTHILKIYDEGVEKIVKGEWIGEEWDFSEIARACMEVTDELLSSCLRPLQYKFEIGGVIYNPDRID